MAFTGLNASLIESLPTELLENIPAAEPPPGVTPDFKHPSTLVPAILSTLVVFSFFAAISFGIRVYTRSIFLKNWRWDDTMVTLGVLFTCLYLSATISGSVFGVIGLHLWEIHVDRAIKLSNTYADYVVFVANPPALGFVKLSFLIQFYYLFKPIRWLRLSCWIGGGLIAFVYTSLWIVSLVLNSPWHGEDLFADVLSWHYLEGTNVNIPTGVLGLATDLFVFVLPIPAVMGLQLSLRKKIGVLSVFALGLVAVIASTMSLYSRILLYQNTNTNQADPTWMSGLITIWTQIELLTGIAAANMPVMHQFFVRKSIFQRIRDQKISTTIKNLMSSSRHHKSAGKDDTYPMNDSFESSLSANTRIVSDMRDERYGSRPEAQIMVSRDYTVTSDML